MSTDINPCKQQQIECGYVRCVFADKLQCNLHGCHCADAPEPCMVDVVEALTDGTFTEQEVENMRVVICLRERHGLALTTRKEG